MTRTSRRFHPYANRKNLVKAHHVTAHFTSGMEVDSVQTKRQKRDGEARMIPGLGALEYGFPNSITTKLRYCSNYSYTSTTGAVTSYILRANGIFDPDYSNVGHQPLYRDTYAGIYDYFVVLGSKIHVEFISESATVGFVVGICASDTPTISTTLDTLCEMNNSVSKLIGSVNTPGTSLFMTYSPQENLGAQGEDDLSMLTPVGSDPSTSQYYGVFIAAADSVSTAKCTIKTTIEYTVKFSTLSKPTQN